ncbi:hypothetical protein [Pseudomonas moraviensis]|uniref:hypothetical protein n=1 Tax=Pseudomonas moraviensis TaxID=321662 RepID=UPI000935D45B|nr:hypothetical protein [Pseudomonas moraviensis]OJT51761.1 hypothetical protein BSZ28_11085 [Pseudomonas moraviensis]
MIIFVTGDALVTSKKLIVDKLIAYDERAASLEILTYAGNLQNLTRRECGALTSSQLVATPENRKRLKVAYPEKITFPSTADQRRAVIPPHKCS